MHRMRTADPDECLMQRTPIVFAADQHPFQVHASTFCLLQPLMTADGVRFGPLNEAFPNRGRVWWMLRDQSEVPPGSLWIGRLQRASIEDVDRPDKDHFQVVRESMEPGLKDWVSVVELDLPMPAVDDLLDGRIPRPTTRPNREVLLRFRDALIGPFRVQQWSPEGWSLSPLDLGRPVLRKSAPKTLRGEQRFEVQLARFTRNPDEQPFDATIALVPRQTAVPFEGEEIDAMSRAQLVKWALDKAGMTKAEQRPIKAALDAVAQLEVDPVDRVRLSRFQGLCERALAGIDVGGEVATVLAQHERFEPFLARHLDAVLARRVDELVATRRREVEREQAQALADLAGTQAALAAARDEFDRLRQDQEHRLAEEHARWLEGLEQREAALAAAERELERSQERIGKALHGAIADYRDRADEVLQHVVALLPLLRPALGHAGDLRSGEAPRPERTALVPAWVQEPRSPTVLRDERSFLDQFFSVVERRGFRFDQQLLTAFHVAVKTGNWTVLAGPSGLGKSSLPVLYAEALGRRLESLMVPVRPDWLDDRQVLGAFNPLTERYETAPTGITEHLIAAAEDLRRERGGIYLIVLDEMNLARVEHYFARFLSIMERRVEDRRIELFSRSQARPEDPLTRHRELVVPPNVRFVGTVNLDETIHFFSPKVLDRCAIVGLQQGELDAAAEPTAQAQQLALTPVAFGDYQAWTREPMRARRPSRRCCARSTASCARAAPASATGPTAAPAASSPRPRDCCRSTRPPTTRCSSTCCRACRPGTARATGCSPSCSASCRPDASPAPRARSRRCWPATSSSMSSAELAVEQGGRRLGAVVGDGLAARAEAVAGHDADAARPIDVRVRTPAGGVLLVANRDVARLAPGEQWVRNVPVRDLFGEVAVVVRCAGQGDESDPDGDPGDGVPRAVELELLLQVRGTPATLEAFEVLIADLERLRPHLLREVAGPIALRRGRDRSVFEPAEELRNVRDWVARMVGALSRIEARPFEALSVEKVLRDYAPGDRIAGDVLDVITAAGTVVRDRRAIAIGRVEVEALRRSYDVPEHRQLRVGCEQLSRRARAIERHCQAVLDAYEVERQRWGGRADSVDEQRHGRRREELRRYTQEARAAATALWRAIAQSRVLAEVPLAAGPLRATPLWVTRSGYREAYGVLRELERRGGGLLVGDDSVLRLRGLDQLFEYWCFVQVVLAVADLAGATVEGSMFELIDDVYRPDLRPGLVLQFAAADGARWAVAYEPTFPRPQPLGRGRGGGGVGGGGGGGGGGGPAGHAVIPGTFRTTLGTGSLRPDIVVRLDRPGRPPRLLVLDAKNSTTFGSEDFARASDYRSRLVDPDTGAQPARWVAFLHRNQDAPLLENVPGLLDGLRGGWDNWYLAACAVVPQGAGLLRRLLRRFGAAG